MSERARAADGPPSRRTQWAALIVGTVVVLVVLAAAAEGAIRLRQKLRYGTVATVEQTYAVDARTGLRVPIANLSSGPISVNSLGFRGPEIVVPKPAGTVRIAFLGASTTWCAEVSGNGEVWPHLVAASLGESFPGVRFDYVNAGVPGYTLDAMRRNLELRVAPLDPDVIVIYEAANNLTGELRALAAQQGIVADTAFRETSWLGTHSLLWNLAEKNLKILLARRAAEAQEHRLDIDPARLGAQYRDELTRLVRAAEQRAPLVAIATFSTQVRRGQTPEQQMRALSSALFYTPFVSARGLVEAYERYNQIARDVARETGALLIAGEDDIPGDPAHFVDTVHFTDAGSAAMARRVSAALAPELKRRVNR